VYYIWIISTMYVDIKKNCKAYPQNPQKVSKNTSKYTEFTEMCVT